jgi:crotonobetainyl-CoA:carnitine CoA-transferase CaiB-like acyl-CoA transferase
MGRPELKSDERFAGVSARNRNWVKLFSLIETWSETRTVRECLDACEATGVPCSHYGAPVDNLSDPHLIARGLFSRVRDGAGEFTGVNPPYRLSATRAELRERVPERGEHTAAVLRDWLGLDAEALAALGIG